MTELTLTKTIDSTHLDLPELRPWLGKEVEIRITERAPTEPEPIPVPEGMALPAGWDRLSTRGRNLWILSRQIQFDDTAYREREAFEWELAQRELAAFQAREQERLHGAS